MRLEYEKIIKLVCGDDWCSQSKTPDEKDGGFGVALALAFIRGVPPRLGDFSRELDVPHYILETAYRRLQVNGLLSARSWLINDPHLAGRQNRTDEDYKHAMILWCHIAGLSSGFIGKGLMRSEYQNR